MAPFRWPSIWHNVALAKEVISTAPEKIADWNTIAANLSKAFSTQETKVEIKGRGCRERMERLIEKHKRKDSVALKRSGTEEDYNELSQLCEDIWTYRRDMQEIKQREMAAKKKTEENRNKGKEMRRSALESISKRRRHSDLNALESSSEDEQSETDDGDSVCSSIASNSKGGEEENSKKG